MSHTTVFVSANIHGFTGTQYYFENRERLGITLKELSEVEVTGPEILVHPDVLQPLHQADAVLRKSGFYIEIREGYRSPGLYHLAHRKLGKNAVLLNMDRMPHASGRAVDITLRRLSDHKRIDLRSAEDAKEMIESAFIDFYAGSLDPVKAEYQRLQLIMRNAMLKAGFTMGTKGEFWHFELP